MTKERAMRLAAKWASGGVCTLSEGEAEEYHALCLEALKESLAYRELCMEKLLERQSAYEPKSVT